MIGYNYAVYMAMGYKLLRIYLYEYGYSIHANMHSTSTCTSAYVLRTELATVPVCAHVAMLHVLHVPLTGTATR